MSARMGARATSASTALVGLATLLAALLPTAAGAAAGTGGFPQPLWSDTAGPVALSSPTVATIDGVSAVVFASENGYLNVVDATTGLPLPGWPEPVELAPGVPSAIESSPTVAYLDGPDHPPSIIVGAGSTYVAQQHGGLVAFRADGQVRFTFHTMDVYNEWSGNSRPGPDGYDEAVFSTPAVGDITGDGRLSIVFGSYDHHLYALRPNGKLVRGFPVDTEDTIWSSPALHHVRGKKRQEDIFIGGDGSGKQRCFGGFVYDFSYRDGAPRVIWQHCETQTIWSSPAVGAINATGNPIVVVGTGFGETPPYLPGSNRLYAYYARSGKRVPGWPVRTAGPTFGSPAIGLLPGGTEPAVVDTSWCLSCAGQGIGSSVVYAYTGRGRLLWSEQLAGANDFSSPVLADLTGSGVNDVVVGSSAGLYALSGVDGSFMFQASEAAPINTCSDQNSVVVADVAGSGPASGWHLFESCGGPRQVNQIGRLIDYPLPAAPAVAPPWPEWRGGPAHSGVANAPFARG